MTNAPVNTITSYNKNVIGWTYWNVYEVITLCIKENQSLNTEIKKELLES
jgi:hypothetical protein